MNFKKYHVSKNLIDFSALKNAESGTIGTADCPHVLTLILKPNTAYTCISNGRGSSGGTADENRSIYFNGSDAYYNNVYNGHPITMTTDNNDVVKVGFFSDRTNAQQYINGSAQVWLVEGSDSTIPYEPYGDSWHDTPHYIHTTSTDTLTTLPAEVIADGNNATVGLVGNMAQSGTPSPSSIIMPSETGERTGNLFDGNYVNAYLTSTGIYNYPDTTTISIIVECKPNTTYTIKQTTNVTTRHKWRIAVFDSVPTNNAQGTILVNDDSLSESTITTLNDSAYIVVYYMYPPPLVNANFMINLGSTALPYEPYGYKIPILSGGTTTNVYLAEVQSTRRIKKLVFDGTENILVSTNNRFYMDNIPEDYQRAEYMNLALCSHYPTYPQQSRIGDVPDKHISFSFASGLQRLYLCDDSYNGNLTLFKQFLTNQYSAGTPVTIWYVLATPTTAIVNEPLRKIGDYADTVSGITVPTLGTSEQFDVDTTLKPSEVSLAYTGWHDATVKEWDGSEWQ